VQSKRSWVQVAGFARRSFSEGGVQRAGFIRHQEGGGTMTEVIWLVGKMRE